MTPESTEVDSKEWAQGISAMSIQQTLTTRPTIRLPVAALQEYLQALAHPTPSHPCYLLLACFSSSSPDDTEDQSSSWLPVFPSLPPPLTLLLHIKSNHLSAKFCQILLCLGFSLHPWSLSSGPRRLISDIYILASSLFPVESPRHMAPRLVFLSISTHGIDVESHKRN